MSIPTNNSFSSVMTVLRFVVSPASGYRPICNHGYFPVLVLAIFLAFLSGTSSAADMETTKRITALTLQGMNHAYNFEFDSAEAKFNEAIQLEPANPRPLVSKTTILFWRFALGNDDSLYAQLLSQADRAIDLAEKYQDLNSRDADPLICLGSLYGYKAFARARQKSYLKAAWDGKKSLDYFTDAVELNPKAYDAYMGLGCYHYFASFAPKGLQWVISILGIEGNAGTGVKELSLARDKGTFTSIEAQYYLAQFLPWQSGNFEKSESLLVDLHKRFPRNPLISFTLSVWEMRRNDPASAKDRLLSIVHEDRGTVPGLKALSLYKLAECNFHLRNYEQAIEEYDAFLSIFHDDNYRATTHFRIGIGYELTGRRGQALKHYQASRQAEHKQGDDRYSSRKAELFYKNPLSATDSLLFRAKSAFKSGKYNQAIALYKELDSSGNASSSLRSEARYGTGESLVEQKKYAEAIFYFSSIAPSNTGSEEWLLPWSHYQLGICHSNLGNLTVAKHEFKQALAFDEEYDFKNWLEFRTERELDRLK